MTEILQGERCLCSSRWLLSQGGQLHSNWRFLSVLRLASGSAAVSLSPPLAHLWSGDSSMVISVWGRHSAKTLRERLARFITEEPQCVLGSVSGGKEGGALRSSGASSRAVGGDRSLDFQSVNPVDMLLKFTSDRLSIKYHCLHLSIRASEVHVPSGHLFLGL